MLLVRLHQSTPSRQVSFGTTYIEVKTFTLWKRHHLNVFHGRHRTSPKGTDRSRSRIKERNRSRYRSDL